MPSTEVILRRKLADEVRDRLLKLIEGGDLTPGSEMPSERELMSRFSVGRPAVREAMQSLEQMGLIEIHHGERARVVPLTPRSMLGQIHLATRHLLATSPETLEHLREARLLFEVGMARRAARLAKPADLERLREVLAEQRARQNHPERFVAADLKFHNLLAQVSGNPVLSAVSDAMLQWLFEFHCELLRFPGNEAVSLAEHELIYQRVAAGDAAGAARAMTGHLNRVNTLNRQGRLSRRGKRARTAVPVN